MIAFDADVLIYAAVPGHPLGRRVAALLPAGPCQPDDPPAGVGSVLLLPELLSKPRRLGATAEALALAALLARLELRPVDRATAELAVVLGGSHGLPAADSVHLATAIVAGAERFLTNNRRDFPRSIPEIDITYPEELPPE
jgi:predicted nucleic acid-binding protein